MFSVMRFGRDFLLIATTACVCLLFVQTGNSQKTARVVRKTQSEKTRAPRKTSAPKKTSAPRKTAAPRKTGVKAKAAQPLNAFTLRLIRQGATITRGKAGEIVGVAITGTSVSDTTLKSLVFLKKLRSLDLTRCTRISNTGLATLKSLTSLNELKLGYCSRINDAGLDHLKTLKNLTSLDLTYLRQVTDAGIKNLTPLKQLKELNLSQCGSLTNAGLAHLKSFPELEKLNLSYCRKWSDAGLKNLAALKKLRELDLANSLVDDEGLKTLAGLPGLKSLRLSYCSAYSLAGVRSLGSGKAKLEVLNVSQNRNFKDDFAKAATKIASLRELDLDATGVTDVGLTHLKSIPNLKALRLSSLTITDTGAAHIAALKNIEELKLYNSQIGDKGLAKLAGCQALKILDLGYCSKITNDGMKHLLKFKKLETLVLRNTSLNDTGMKSLKALIGLKDLNLAYCRTVTTAGLTNLRDMKKLRILNLSYTNTNNLGLTHVGTLKELRELNLRSCRTVTDLSKLSGLTNMEKLDLSYCRPVSTLPLRTMTKLTYLRMYQTRLSDAGAMGLARLKNLRTLDLNQTRMTANGYRAIRAALPNTQISGSPTFVGSRPYVRPSTNSVKVIVKGQFDNAAKRAILARLKAAAAITQFSFYVIADQKDGTLFELSPVDNPSDLAAKLKAAKLAKTATVDATKREVTIELLPPETTIKPKK